MENKKTKHLGHKYWNSDEENLVEDVNAEASDTDSFIQVSKDIKKEKQ